MRLAGWRSREMIGSYGASADDERARDAHKKAGLGDRFYQSVRSTVVGGDDALLPMFVSATVPAVTLRSPSTIQGRRNRKAGQSRLARIERVAFDGLAGNSRTREFTLNRDVNIFWGLNGCGKTSLLKILHSALANERAELSRIPIGEATVDIIAGDLRTSAVLVHSKKGTKAAMAERALREATLDIEDMAFEEDPPTRVARSWAYSDAPEGRRRGFDYRYLPVSRLPAISAHAQMRRARLDRVETDFLDQLFVEGIQEAWREYATQELLAVRRIQQQGLADMLTAVIERGASTQPRREISTHQASSAVQKFFKSQNIALPNTTMQFLVTEFPRDEIIQKAVLEIFDVQDKVEKAQEPTHKMKELIERMFTGGKKVRLTPRSLVVTSRDATELPVEALSSGEKQLLRLFVECRAAGKSAIIIDEPELSMHVDWQHSLIESMRLINPEAQIIVATHSPEIMADIDDDKIFEL